MVGVIGVASALFQIHRIRRHLLTTPMIRIPEAENPFTSDAAQFLSRKTPQATRRVYST